MTGAKGPQKIKGLLERIADEANIPEPARELLNNLASQLAAIEVRLAALAAKLMAHHKADPRSQLLATVPGVGPITAVSIALKVPDATVFRSGRHFAAWLGITPREHSTAGRQRLGKISREGDESLRRLLVLGATSVIQQVERRRKANKTSGSDAPWLLQLLAAQAEKARGDRAGQQDGPHHPGHAGERRTLPPTTDGLSLSPPLSGTCKDGSKMAIGRSEDRDNPGNPAMLRHHVHVRDPIRVTHLGQRSCDRTTQAGHMTAIDQDRHPRCTALARRGPSTYGFQACGAARAPKRQVNQVFSHQTEPLTNLHGRTEHTRERTRGRNGRRR